jgi:hypothetical protein
MNYYKENKSITLNYTISSVKLQDVFWHFVQIISNGIHRVCHPPLQLEKTDTGGQSYAKK